MNSIDKYCATPEIQKINEREERRERLKGIAERAYEWFLSQPPGQVFTSGEIAKGMGMSSGVSVSYALEYSRRFKSLRSGGQCNLWQLSPVWDDRIKQDNRSYKEMARMIVTGKRN